MAYNDREAINIPASLRSVSPDDLESIMRIHHSSIPFNPLWMYRFPGLNQFPSEYDQRTRQRYLRYMDKAADGEYMFQVAETPLLGSVDGKTEVLGFSIWRFPGTFKQKEDSATKLGRSLDSEPGPDVNLTRKQKLYELNRAARRELFLEFEEQQLFLIDLEVDARFYRRGIGSQLLFWGIEKARSEDIVITVFASNMGRDLYLKHGFQERREISSQVVGEADSITQYMMIFWP